MTSNLRFSVAALAWLVVAASAALTAQTTKPSNPDRPVPGNPTTKPAKPAPTTPLPKPAPSTPAAAPSSKPAAVAPVTRRPAPASVVPDQGKAPVTEVFIEIRADGLAYLPGSKQPFTGQAIAASKNFEDCVESITPYKNGRLHGDVMTLFKAGNPKTVRTYADGLPKKFVTYYQDGAKKFEQSLNAKDKAEGLYRRWFPTGQLQAEATYDDGERWHGENKEYTEDGKLKAHYVFEHGAIQKIVYESLAAKAAREAPPTPPVPARR